MDHRPTNVLRNLDEPPAASSSTVQLNDVSLSISTAAAAYSALRPIPSLTLPAKRRAPRRPSTASSVEERGMLLPSRASPSATDLSTTAVTPASDVDEISEPAEEPEARRHDGEDDSRILEMNRRAHATVEGLREEASRLAYSVNILQSPFDPSPADDQLSTTQSTVDKCDQEGEYDWATFINAYAMGRWDPLRTPTPPRSYLHAPTHSRVCRSDSETSIIDQPPRGICVSPAQDDMEMHAYSTGPSTFTLSLDIGSDNAASNVDALSDTLPVFQSTPSVQSGSRQGAMSKSKRLNVPFSLGVFPHRLRSSFTDLRPSVAGTSYASPSSNDGSREIVIPNTDAATTAAAMRWAAARVSVAPLALPSPEHELTDPMRGVTATIPGSHPPDAPYLSLPANPSPGTVRKSRLSSFWQGTQDVEDGRLPVIRQSPPGSVDSAVESSPEAEQIEAAAFAELSRRSDHKHHPLPLVRPSLPPATAPVKLSAEQTEEDYFGPTSIETTVQTSDPPMSHNVLPDHHPARQVSAPPFDDPQTVPALPRRICLTRQTSAPLPTQSLYERRMRSSRPASESFLGNLTGRAAKEEQMYSELGYLAPPNPPDELERRRALYKFNIWGTGRDVNFDRIVHLVKLVFNTKVVTISLVDGMEEFFKSESGLGMQNMSRTISFDAHTILQRDDEPTIVLDASEDWRFAKNPLVIGDPEVRFYAGCPLRTQEGFNIGSLSIIDDTPRREFSPRQRHTLKEFAQVAMRELELWKDKIQLRIRDRIQTSMEQFTRECLDLDKEAESDKGVFSSTSMEQVYLRAARLVKRTLDVEGAIVLDVCHVDVIETLGMESAISVTLHNANRQAGSATSTKALVREEYARLQEFFAKNPEGKVCEGIVPATLRPFLPQRIQYALAVPIFNIDKQPFALLCAYSTGERTTPFLEGHELSYLRAIGVIILSAVLKRRMILADKAKSLFISNISHELRTPLHGILASAELLSDTPLDHSQASFLHTVQACGTSLVETVNHVLDFTKLSGNAKAGGVEPAINHSRVDLMQLIEEATEGCWIGHRARMFTSEIGSVYSPPKADRSAALLGPRHVETVIDVGHSKAGWTFLCEKGGIRRILMNVFGNSLKFTTDGYVHVMLRQLPPSDDVPRDKIRIELSVIDTGKGISQNFLKNQLFHPFSQENPLQTGTGLGLAIVNSIVRSKSVDGKVDVWSAEGVGTEIKITLAAEVIGNARGPTADEELAKVYEALKRPRISLLGFQDPHRGVQLLRNVTTSYLVSGWGFDIADDDTPGQMVIVNEDLGPIALAIQEKDPTRPFILLSSSRGDQRLMNTVGEYERIGGFCRIVYKPVGPVRLHAALRLCLHVFKIGQGSKKPTSHVRPDSPSTISPAAVTDDAVYSTFSRRFSEETTVKSQKKTRPLLGHRAATAHPGASWSHVVSPPAEEVDSIEHELPDSAPSSPRSDSPTVSIGTSGTLLRTSVGSLDVRNNLRVLVIEDNSILRNLLVKWLTNKGYNFREAVDGQEGVRVFENDGRFDVVLVDLSMPVLDGVSATTQMRLIESTRKLASPTSDQAPARILALTGMSSLEDKRRAFEAGVDGYMVKPVAFKTLDIMFHKLGVVS